MHFVAALDRVPRMRCVLCLFEGVATGAADGYGRMAGRWWSQTVEHSNPQIRRQRRCRTRPAKNRVAEQRSNQRYDHPHEQPQ
jgi:acetolactate synthase-1/2/3 large subunit